MQVVYTTQDAPQSLTKSIYLAGPTPRSQDVQSWRPEALRLLESYGYDGVVFVPELASGEWRHSYDDQLDWEERYMHMSDCILFWVPRKLDTMPAFTTNTEWGIWQSSGKVVFGAPPEAANVGYQLRYAKKLQVPLFASLEETIQAALSMVGEGVLRSGGEREIPLYIWKSPHFQQWYAALKRAGNRLDGARVEWTFRVGPQKDIVFFWALHVNVYIASENRNKTNEVVISRPDIVTVVMFHRGTTLDDTDVVLVREFRSPVANQEGFVWEAPGGSSFRPKKSLLELAADECSEETGFGISTDRMRQHEPRQLVATLSAHRAHLFSVEITDEELAHLRLIKGVPHGVLEDSERTYVEVLKLGEIRQRQAIDWSMLGMILSVLA